MRYSGAKLKVVSAPVEGSGARRLYRLGTAALAGLGPRRKSQLTQAQPWPLGKASSVPNLPMWDTVRAPPSGFTTAGVCRLGGRTLRWRSAGHSWPHDSGITGPGPARPRLPVASVQLAS